MKLSQKNELKNNCKQHTPYANALFELKQLQEQNRTLYEKSCPQNLIILILDGAIQININDRSERTIVSGQMLSVARNSSYKIMSNKYSKLLFLYFEHIFDLCPGLFIKDENIETPEYKANSLTLKQPIIGFTHLMETYLNTCNQHTRLHSLKKNEFFLLLNLLYNKEELKLMLYPIIENSSLFRQFVLEHYDKVNNVTEMIKCSNLSKSVFYSKFKKEFGVSAKQWMLTQIKEKISKRALTPQITAKTLMNEFNFSSPEHFNSFCKKQFGLTPTQLIKGDVINTNT